VVRLRAPRPRRDTLEESSEPDVPDFVLADLLTLAPHLRPRYPHVLPNPSLDPQFERQRMYDSFVLWCERLATSTPLLLLVEDVHWADHGTLALLRHMARRVRRARLFLVVTYRDTEMSDQGHPLHSMLLDLNRERLVENSNSRLNREQARDLPVPCCPQQEILPQVSRQPIPRNRRQSILHRRSVQRID
jgi:hypothetical protein